MRYAAKRDASERAILEAYRSVGAAYLLIDAFDALVWFRGRLFMMEHKSKGGRKTESQERLEREGWPLQFVSTPEGALQAIGAGRSSDAR